MNRCPECDFLYEDDQRLCDMDGTALVYDAHAFPEDHALAGHASKHIWQRFAVALPLTVLAGLAFYVLQHQPIPQSNHPAAVVVASESEATTASASSATSSTIAPASSVGAESDAGNIERPKESSPKTETGSGAAAETAPNQTESATKGEQGGDVNAAEGSTENVSTPAASAAPATRSAVKPVRPRTTSARRVSGTNYGNQKKDSPITSFFKKTGKILKKPFKL